MKNILGLEHIQSKSPQPQKVRHHALWSDGAPIRDFVKKFDA